MVFVSKSQPGLSYHASAADPRQESIAELFLVNSAQLDFSSAFAPRDAPAAAALH